MVGVGDAVSWYKGVERGPTPAGEMRRASRGARHEARALLAAGIAFGAGRGPLAAEAGGLRRGANLIEADFGAAARQPRRIATKAL